ncbi:unnamed protein product [Ixodes hexagonus]
MLLRQFCRAPFRTSTLWLFLIVQESVSEIWESVNTVVSKGYHLHVISNCHEFPVTALKNIREPFAVWNADGLGTLLRSLSVLRGYKSDVLVPCWNPDPDHFVIHVENRDVPYKHIRWIFSVDDRTSERSMSKLFQRIDCRAVIVTSAAAYVPLDTYTNCSKGVRQMSRESDPAFEDRPIANLTVFRLINQVMSPFMQEWNYARLEPQTTIIESIVQKSGIKVGQNLSWHCEKFGRSNEHHRFMGALGAIQNKEADLGAFEIFLTESILYGVDLAGMARYDAVTFFAPLPHVITDLAIIARPFSKNLWMAIWASLSVYLVLLFAFSQAEQQGHHTKTHRPWQQLTNTLFYLVETAPSDGGCTNTLCCLNKVAGGTHVFVTNKQDTKLLMGRTFVGTLPASENFFLVHVAIVSPKMSPYTRAFYNIAERLTETGISTECRKLGKYRNLDWRTSWLADHDQHHHFCQALRLEDIVGLILVLGLGLLAGTVTLLGELAVSRMLLLRRLKRRPRGRRARMVKKISIAVKAKDPHYDHILSHMIFQKPK